MSLEVDIKKSFPDFSLDISICAQTETLGFLGESGCGKSLTLRCIAGIETPDEGRIVVNGNVFFDSAEHINIKPQQRKTALLFQDYMLFPNLTVAQNIAAGIDKHVSKAERNSKVAFELKRFGLVGFDERYPAQLSGGQQQRVALARMLAANPDILMLDEPFSALDAHLKGVLEQNLVDLFDGFDGTIVYVSHDVDEALRFCDRIAVVDAGHIVEIDIGDELVNHPKSEAALKLSGCKNSTPVERIDDHHVHAVKWGIDIYSTEEVPADVAYLGLRARYIERAEGSGQNCYRMRVDRVSNARFEQTLLLGFVDRDEADSSTVERSENEMTYLHQHMFWTIDKTLFDACDLPCKGDELWVRIPSDRIYLVSK